MLIGNFTMSSGVARRCFFAAVLAVFLLSVTSSCGGSRGVTVGHASGKSYSKGRKADVKSSSGSGKTGNLTSPLPLSSSLSPSTRKLLQQAYGWLGTPYAYGGTDHSGVDCSGLVMSVYRDALDIKLPRSSSKQKEYCQPLDFSSISEGDLLFSHRRVATLVMWGCT